MLEILKEITGAAGETLYQEWIPLRTTDTIESLNKEFMQEIDSMSFRLLLAYEPSNCGSNVIKK
nr:hypothetical protein [Deltaproteobacteria bacterium]